MENFTPPLSESVLKTYTGKKQGWEGDNRFGGFKNLIHVQERCVSHPQ